MSHRLLTPGLEGPAGNPLRWRVRGGRDDSKCPCPPLSISTGFVAGGPVCPEPTCTHPGFPVEKLSGPLRAIPCRREAADTVRPACKSNNLFTLKKKCLLQEAGGQGEKGTTGNESHTDKTEPVDKGHGHTERSVLAL